MNLETINNPTSWVILLLLLGGLLVLGVLIARRRPKPLAPLKEALPPEAQKAPHLPAPPEAPTANLASALAKTRSGWVQRLSQALFSSNRQKGEVFEEIEAILFGADIGVRTSEKLLNRIKIELDSEQLQNAATIQTALESEIEKILFSVESKALATRDDGPCVIMFVGVNGVGKTTTIGKIAAQLTAQGHKVVLGAGDTFRAAAADQLAIWADRSKSTLVRGAPEADPASVLFDAVKLAKDQGADFVLCDTAGRLHTKVNLMEELKKVHRVLGKAVVGAPHETLLVVDATTGQNAIEQARQFQAATPLSGIVLTKLDGTAKGGIVIGIADEMQTPIRYIGVGEGAFDLRAFEPKAFVEALFDREGEQS